eukprot:3374083-Pleurochrysis_carterae.AAC.1
MHSQFKLLLPASCGAAGKRCARSGLPWKITPTTCMVMASFNSSCAAFGFRAKLLDKHNSLHDQDWR